MESEIIAFVLSQKWLSSIGLGLDILGALLIWKFGIPSVTDRDGAEVLALRTGASEQRQEKNKSKVYLYDLASAAGFWVLIIGFSLQLVSNWVS